MIITGREKILLSLLISGCIAAGAEASEGERVDVNSGKTVEMITGTFGGLPESGTTGTGAAVRNSGTINCVSEGKFMANSAVNSGGAISNDGKGHIIIIENSTFTENRTTARSGYGGAIYNYGSNSSSAKIDEITGSTFTSNEAFYGGAIVNTYGEIGAITDSTFEKNIAGNSGGAIRNLDGTINVIEGCNFTDNQARIAGAIYNVNSVISSISNTTFKDNSAGAHGGAICNDGRIEDITDNTFEKNTSGNFGGAIFNNGGTILTIGASESDAGDTSAATKGSFFTANSSDLGGAIYNTATRTHITVESSEGVTVQVAQIFDPGDDEGMTAGTFLSILGNTFEKNAANDSGGAIYNYHGGAIGEIRDNRFTGNHAGGGNGGAVENAEYDASIGTMDGNIFAGNVAGGNGGAIYNQGSIGIKTDSNQSDNTVTGITNSTFTGNSAANGGAIYNNYTTGAASVYVSAQADTDYEIGVGGNITPVGGATVGYLILNSEGTGTEITQEYSTKVLFDSTNYPYIVKVISDSTVNGAGAIGDITGSAFDGNAALGTVVTVDGNGDPLDEEKYYYAGDAYGGAIYNASGGSSDGKSYTCTIASITNSSFTNNSATSTDGAAKGGAIYNIGTIGSIELTTLTGNSASGATEAAGGAIYNEDANATITVSGSITDNYAVATSGTAQGGAIYTRGDVNVIADGQNISVSGNKANDDDNAIYMAGTKEDQAVRFTLSNGASVLLADNIQGEGNYSVEISGDGTDNIFYLLNDVNAVSDVSRASLTSVGCNNANLSIGGVTLNTIDGEIHTYYTNSFSLTGNFDMVADVDLKNETMDHFETTDHENGGTYGTAGGKLTVTGMNIISDTTSDSVAVYFAEPGLMTDVASGITGLPDSNQLAFTPIYKYNVYYVYKDDDTITYAGDTYDASGSTLFDSESDDGGYFVFAKYGSEPERDPETSTDDDTPSSGDNPGSGNTGSHDRLESYNPAVLASEVAMAGAYGAMNLMFEYNFEHSDYYMKLPEEVRLAKGEDEPRESDATKPAYYNQHELTYRGAWTRAFASNEGVDYQDGFSSRDKYYGAMFGFDTKMNVHDNGWASVFTGYAGMMGIHQSYSGGLIKQHGGFIGATASFYKKNFYTAWTIAGGTMKAHESTMYGKDKERLDSYGIAGRIGYNIKLGDEGKFTLLPTFTASFTYINPEDYTNAAGVKFSGSGFSAVQLNPNVKLIWNRPDGWYPYLTVGEVWTGGESSHVKATWAGQTHSLTTLDLDPYTEYGIGVQKRWANERDAYVQVLGHSHGRDGILINAGIRWNF